MAILVICQDSEQAQRLRKQYLQAHLDYIESILEQVDVAGPIKQHQVDHYDGSCFIYATDDMQYAKQLFENDPYAQHGVYRSHSFARFLPAAGNWVGGKTW